MSLPPEHQSFLEAKGSVVGRLRVLPPGEVAAIQNDVYDETRNNLIEAKGSGTRASIRMAIGQLGDYGRFAHNAARAVLLPARPRPDLEELLVVHAISAVWPDDASFVDNAQGRFV